MRGMASKPTNSAHGGKAEDDEEDHLQLAAYTLTTHGITSWGNRCFLFTSLAYQVYCIALSQGAKGENGYLNHFKGKSYKKVSGAR
jgi:hypothetical protein